MPTGAVAGSPGLSVSRYFGESGPNHDRQSASKNRGFGCLNVTTRVRASGAVMVFTGPRSAPVLAAFVTGSRMRSRLRFIDAASKGVPSWNFTPSRSANVNFCPSPSILGRKLGRRGRLTSSSLILNRPTTRARAATAAIDGVDIIVRAPRVAATPERRARLAAGTGAGEASPSRHDVRGRPLHRACRYAVQIATGCAALLAATMSPSPTAVY